MGHHYLCGEDRSHTAFVGIVQSQPATYALVVDEDGDLVQHETANSVPELVASLGTSFPIPFNIEQMLEREFDTLHRKLAA